MISFKLLTLASTLLLSSIGVEGLYTAVSGGTYNSYCGSVVNPEAGAICFESSTSFDKQFTGGSDGLMGFMAEDKKSIAFVIGPPKSRAELTMPKRRISMLSKKVNDGPVCVSVVIQAINGATDTRMGMYCPGDAHIRL